MRKYGYLVWSIMFAACSLIFVAAQARAQSGLRVYKAEAEAHLASEMLYNYLTEIAWEYLDQRQQKIASITTADQVVARQQEILKKLYSIVGDLPERTPLRAQVTGSFEREGYRVEKVVFQSRPQFYVTATLYLPDKPGGPFPAILGPCGHSYNGKAAEVYQRVYAGLARLGFVVLTYDPPGQGERFMYYVEDLGESLFGPQWPTTIEHTMGGIQCLLTGSNAANYFIWDGMRGIDYLQSRPEVDPKRIGVTGNSGGGNLTAYISAMDSRVAAAVPSCYITSWRRLWETIGPQDAEQNLLPFIGSGLDFADYIIACAPKPYLINTAIRDFFNIRGARETYAEAKRIYELLGAGDKLKLFEADDVHGYSQPRRESAYEWFGTHLLGLTGPHPEAPLQIESDHDLQVTPTGQVCTSYPDAETMGSLNAAYARDIMPKVPKISSMGQFEKFRDELLEKVRELIHYRRSVSPLNVQNRGYESRPGMKVELLTFDSEPGITIPALLFRPAEKPADAPAVLYLADRNKADDAMTEIASLVENGHMVLAPDVRGKGETARSNGKSGSFAEWFSEDYDIPMMAFHVNKTLVGMQTVDIMSAVDLLTSLYKDNSSRLIAVGKGSATIPLLHAAAFDSRITSVILEGGLVSWKAVVESKYHRNQLDNVVPGALAVYDLPLLAATIAPRPMVLANSVNPLGRRLSLSEQTDQHILARDCFSVLGEPQNLIIADRRQGIPLARAYANVLGR
jgi:cephalosporin-C deacetylase-like acetyl esterase